MYCALDIFNTAFFSVVPSVTATVDKLLMFDPITELADKRSLFRLDDLSETETAMLFPDTADKIVASAVDVGMAEMLRPDILPDVHDVIASPKAV